MRTGKIDLNERGLKHAKAGEFQAALQCFQAALQEDPCQGTYHINLSNCYVALKELSLAERHLHQALNLNPQDFTAYNNLGRLYYKKQLTQDSIRYFEKALRLNPEYWEAHYNLALCFSKQNCLSRAITHYEKVIQTLPNHATAHYNLGLIYFEEGDFLKASRHLEKALSVDPGNGYAHRFLAECLLFLGEVQKGLEQFQQALKLTETDPLLQAEIHHNLAVLYLRQENKTQALFHFEQALKKQPQNETALHMIAALRGEELNQPSSDYVRDLFDQYADHYNQQMKEKLEYTAPSLLRNAMATCLQSKLRVGRVLDLGCGTGLCGVYFRELALELVGVDISEKMLDKAKMLNAYDELIKDDIIHYLSKPSLLPFDFILAADVLVYFGKLEDLFQEVARVLAPFGRFGFTLEELTSSTSLYRLQPTGRFAHSRQYIQALCDANQLVCDLEEKVVLRKQAGEIVQGRLYILKRLKS